MANKKKPVLVQVGDHLIDPGDIACITKINKKDLYIIRLKSQPNMEWPIWAKEKDVAQLSKHLTVIVSDD